MTKKRQLLKGQNSEKSANCVTQNLPRMRPNRVGKRPRGWKPSLSSEDVLFAKARKSKQTCLKFARVLLRPDLRVFFRLRDKELQISDHDLLNTLRVARRLSSGNDDWRRIQEYLCELLEGDWRRQPTARDARKAIAVLGNLREFFQFDVTCLQTELDEIASHWQKNRRKPPPGIKGRKFDPKKQQILAAMELLTKACGKSQSEASDTIADIMREAKEKCPTAESIQDEYTHRYRSLAPHFLDHALSALAPYLEAAMNR